MSIEFSPDILDKAEAAKDRLEIHIHFSPHATKEDFAQAGELIRSRRFDIYAPESAHGSPRKTEVLNRISEGDKRVYFWANDIFKRHNAQMAMAAAGMYFASKMPIITPDITREEGLRYEVSDLPEGDDFFELNSFENDYQRTKEKVHEHAKNAYFRDHLIATKLPALAIASAEMTPRLRNRESLKVLATMGTRHTMISHLLSHRGYQVSRSFNELPYVFSPFDTAVRQVAFGHKISEAMYMDAFKQFVVALPLADYAKRFSGNTTNEFAFTRKVVDMISDDTAIELYELLKADAPSFKETADSLLALAEAA